MNHRFTPNDVTPDVLSSLISYVGEGKGQTVPRLLSVLVTRDLQGIERMRAGWGWHSPAEGMRPSSCYHFQ